MELKARELRATGDISQAFLQEVACSLCHRRTKVMEESLKYFAIRIYSFCINTPNKYGDNKVKSPNSC